MDLVEMCDLCKRDRKEHDEWNQYCAIAERHDWQPMALKFIPTKAIKAIDNILNHVRYELTKALATYPSMHSAHEGYAVILEEVDELKDEVWMNPKERIVDNMRNEAIQVAAMAIRFVLDVCDKGE